jgi:small subunit ribosomal protein S15
LGGLGYPKLEKKMARMHSGKKGKAGSTKPVKKAKPSWLGYKPKEVEQLVLKIAKGDKTSSQIGITLRDTYGIPDVKTITKKTITKIMADNKISPKLPEDFTALILKHIALMKHLESNKQDQSARRGLLLTESKIKRLMKYYKKKGVLAKDWTYDRTKAKLLVS